MNGFLKSATVAFVCLLGLSCQDRTTGLGPQPLISFTATSSKCLSHGSPRINGIDSAFTYTFTDSLVVNFTVIANCCPDSNRFSISQVAGSDTLIITVADTADNGCRCVCPYSIHSCFANLPNHRYVVRCILCGTGGCDDPVFVETVLRRR